MTNRQVYGLLLVLAFMDMMVVGIGLTMMIWR